MLVFLSACSYEPEVNMRGVNQERYDRDLKACTSVAEKADDTCNLGGNWGGGGGGNGGAVYALIIGGVLLGCVTYHEIADMTMDYADTYAGIMDQCMREKGYRVIE